MAAKSFRHLIKKPLSGKETLRLLRNIPQMPDQAVVLMCGALIDRALEKAILFRMVQMKKKYQQEIFEGRGPAAGMWGKIRIGFALAIFDLKFYNEFEKIRQIRNVFAHTTHEVSFKTPRIAKHCATLKIRERALPPVFEGLWGNSFNKNNPRERFIRASLLLWTLLSFQNYPARHETCR